MKLNNLKTKARNFMSKAKPFALSFIVAYTMIFSNVAFAAGGGDIFELIIKLLGAFCLAGAAIGGILGAIAYAEAKSEGEGPAMAKAKNQITSAVMLGILGAALALGAPTLAAFINDAITL